MIKDSIKKIFKNSDDKLKIEPLKQANFLNQMNLVEFKKLMQAGELHHFLKLSPKIDDKKILLLSFQTTNHFIPKLLGRNPELLVNYQVETNYPSIKKNVVSIKGSLNPFALKSELFEVIYLPLATQYQRDFMSIMSEINRLMANKSKLIISLIHPQAEWLIENQNPKKENKRINQISDYLEIFKEYDFYLEKMDEVMVDEKVKPFFTSSELLSTQSAYYDEFRGFPLLVLFKLIKFKKTSSQKSSTHQTEVKLMDETNTQYLKNIYGL